MAFDIREYVESNLACVRPAGGDELSAECPACGVAGKFYINAETGRYVCHRARCAVRGGSVIGLVAIIEGVSFGEARLRVARQTGVLRRKKPLLSLRERIHSLRDRASWGEPPNPDTDLEPVNAPLPPTFRPCYLGGRWELPRYLTERGIKSDTARRWKLGYCRVGRYAGRLIIPIECPGGRSFTARTMVGGVEPKYVNPPGADHGRLLIGWNMARIYGAELVLCEGPLDVVKLWQHGVSALALGGKELRDAQFHMLRSYLAGLPESPRIVIMLDPEEYLGPLTIARKLALAFPCEKIFVAQLPVGIDPGASTGGQARRAIWDAEAWTNPRMTSLRRNRRASHARLEALCERDASRRVVGPRRADAT